MRQPSRHLSPGGIALGLQQVGDIVEHHDQAGIFRLAKTCRPQQQHLCAVFQFPFDLPLPFHAGGSGKRLG